MQAFELARDLAIGLDATHLAHGMGLHPDPWQERVLRSQEERILLNCCRQSGKSTMTSLLAEAIVQINNKCHCECHCMKCSSQLCLTISCF